MYRILRVTSSTITQNCTDLDHPSNRCKMQISSPPPGRNIETLTLYGHTTHNYGKFVGNMRHACPCKVRVANKWTGCFSMAHQTTESIHSVGGLKLSLHCSKDLKVKLIVKSSVK